MTNGGKMKRISKKQQTAQIRNFNIFRLRGILATLKTINSVQDKHAVIINLNNAEAYIKLIINKHLGELR